MDGEFLRSITHDPITRRAFLKISGVLGMGVTTCPVGVSLAEAVRFDKGLFKVSRSRPCMGTLVSIMAFDPSKEKAQGAIELAFEEMERLTRLMSRYDPNSPVASLNRDGFLEGMPPELHFVVRASMRYHTMSDGLFDITVKPILDMYAQFAQGLAGVSAHAHKIHDMLNLVDARLISMNRKAIAFTREGMGITLDGIAKGIIVDEAAEILKRRGVQHALINAGGDIRTVGDKGNNRPWNIAIEDPLKRNNYPDIIQIKDGAVATSGNYEAFFDREKILHHIVSPKNGLSPLINASVSVQAPTAMEADALSTTLFLLNPGRGMRLMHALPHCECLVVTRNNMKIKSRGWKGRTTS
jgi:thiamine biosynthesis lipoprotein